MKKIWMFLLTLILFWLNAPFALGSTLSFSHVTMHDQDIVLTFKNDLLTLTNTSTRSLKLHDTAIEFYYAGSNVNLKSISFADLHFDISKQIFAHQPNSAGNLYRAQLIKPSNWVLKPGQSVLINLQKDGQSEPHGFRLIKLERVAVPVTVTTNNQNWVQTISICNTTANAIPLTDIEFSFNYTVTMPTNIWGQPWAAWRVASQQGTLVTLLGGTPWTPPLQPDPNCQNPLTIQFNSSPSTPAPTAPFVFKAEGGKPSGLGKMTVSLSAAPASGLPNPQITVTGMGSTLQQAVTWGSQWMLNNLTPGSYTVTGQAVNNGNDFFVSNSVNVTVNDQTTAQATVTYTSVPSGNVTVNLINAPQTTVPVVFTGQKYTLQKNIATNTSVKLPNDTYTLSSNVPGYTASFNPNPLVVPNNTTLSITYQKSTVSTGPRFVGYFQSWTPDPQSTDGTKTNLANLPAYMNVVMLSFVKPDATYTKGSMSLSGTGLEFNYSGAVLKQAINTLHTRNPNTKVLVAVGGASYTNWAGLNTKAIADFVADFGLDGVDVDYEPATTGCALGSDNRIHCQIDTAFQNLVQSLRTAVPRPLWLVVTGFSVGAYGEDQWRTAPPASQYTGMMLPLLRSSAAQGIDMVNVMSYDAGSTFNPVTALAAYTNYYAGPLSMGVEVPPEAWGDNVYTLCKVITLTNAVKTNATQKNIPPGMMIWSVQKKPNGTPTPNNPSAQMMATTICSNLGLSNCNEPLLING